MISILAASGAEQGFFETFGVNWPFFIAQFINFIIVLLVLKKFAFGPIQEILEKRRGRIADGEAKLEEIEQKLADSEKEKAALLEKANADAKRLIGEAKTSATALSEQKAQEATSQAQTILSKAQVAAEAERATMAADLKKEFGRLVVATTTQVTGKTLDENDQKRINEEAVLSINN
ncbi:F0F1 ATP synthase subunit B [Akkermansiaceae bacterium]|nr:F0F1 ATP synthase subunit B [Akkermansiaceae bacterium]MDB4317432.1 F0F1 ATP synthase subunit B [bacterium]MDA7675198.1 F0F1 ATP synthase subunit B [Akkermansiaceae bacterium]MDA7931744.1 F0F1 ATP synthase subunit B [Akkermansiaceae bacterium]MDA8991907.1 F0F1 ATP synthase subunit B [Akkermansiaceae bacterium]